MLNGQLVNLRAIERDDLPLIAKWRNSAEVYSSMFEADPISIAQQERWFDNLLQSQDRCYFVIDDLNSCPKGLIYLFRIDWRNRNAEWGFYLGDSDSRLAGHAAEAELLLLKYAFDHLNLHRVYCQTFAFNSKVLSMHRRFGFVEEGRLREHIYHRGSYEDVVIMAVTESEFRSKEAEITAFLQRLGNRD